MNWATHVLQCFLQKDAIMKIGANLEKKTKFGLQIEIHLYEVGIASNRALVRHGEYVLEPCTHRPSHQKNYFCTKYLFFNYLIILLIFIKI